MLADSWAVGVEFDNNKTSERDDACSAASVHTCGLMRSLRAGATIRRWRDHESPFACFSTG